MEAQTVIYRLDEAHRPTWQYHSMPESVVGGGNTLDEAREAYRGALRFSLDTDQLPTIHEYIEQEAHLGIWVRTPMQALHREGAVKEIARQISFYPQEDIDWFYRNPTAGGDPVIVPATPDETLHGIFAQMSPFDSVILVMGLGDGVRYPKKLMWLVIAGLAAERANGEEPPLGLDQVGLTPETPLPEVFAVALKHYERLGSDHANKSLALLAPA